ncbi:UNVERIFIED_CONTAM: Retrovirus-related Pol polyprotein from transposon RE1 [Sesamum latifolium]|uniref:Retrovirus-related Pol polyprotein from transposon RE1 n=1 Tax=Sesamum latifolium TaxID=2727402 RepID=A0AAW2X250_9LAMI
MKRGILLSQEGFAKKLVTRFGVDLSKKCSAPLDGNVKLRQDGGLHLPGLQLYRALIGSPFDLTISRPDITFSVGLVSCFMPTPRKPHLEAAKKILKYVNTTLDVG